ncbi:hypothetical protein NL676_034738 [Syzygium grande]|nr:hypothetical protein NL676_034738 [Syzygium grande]
MRSNATKSGDSPETIDPLLTLQEHDCSSSSNLDSQEGAAERNSLISREDGRGRKRERERSVAGNEAIDDETGSLLKAATVR